MFNNKKAAIENKSWSSQDLINLSRNLAEAYLPGLNNARSERDEWTMCEFTKAIENRNYNKSGVA